MLARLAFRRVACRAQLKEKRSMLINLIVGLPFMLLCLVLQAAVTFWSIRFYMRQSTWMAADAGLFTHVRPLLLVMIAMTMANFVQIASWGALFLCLGEFSAAYEAIYHSAVNFTSLGYGDVVMSARWKLMGPLEAVNGILMLGATSAALVAIMQHMIKVHFHGGAD
jgi:hypothetical protein